MKQFGLWDKQAHIWISGPATLEETAAAFVSADVPELIPAVYRTGLLRPLRLNKTERIEFNSFVASDLGPRATSSERN